MLKRKGFKIKIILGILFFLFSVICFIIYYQNLESVENTLTKFVPKDKYNYYLNDNEKIGIIEIPKISLVRELYAINSKYNNINKNIEINKSSSMPDVVNGNFILEAHSGKSKIAYFKDLNKLDINDNVYIYYNNNRYTYKITNIYKINKNGTAKIIRENCNTLTMITCDMQDKTKQIVIISKLIKEAIE